MGWRALKAGAMVEVANGSTTLPNGREVEQTSTIIVGEGQLIERDLSQSMVERYDNDDPYVRSIVERVAITTDEDGNKTAVPVGRPESASEPPATDEEAVERLRAAETDLAESEAKVTAAQSELEQVRTESAAELEQLQGELEQATGQLNEANEQLKTAVTFDDLSAKALAVEADQRELSVTRADGKQGDPLKSDLVNALEAHQASE